MRIIEYQKSYLTKELEKIGNKPTIILLLLLVFLLIFVFTGVFSLVPLPEFLKFLEPVKKFFPSIAIFFLIVFLLFSILGGFEYLDSLIDKLDSLIKGEEGENRVINFLKRHLSDKYVYIKNYELSNIETGDIDGILIGPKGIILLEIKNYHGLFRVSGQELYRKERGKMRYKLYYKNPIRQILEREFFLNELLKDNNINIKTIPIVVFVNGKIENVQGLDNCFVIEYYKLVDFINKLTDIENWNKDLEKKILDVLKIKNNN